MAEAYAIHWHHQVSRRNRKRLAQELLQEFGLNEKQFSSQPHMLSGGECKRVLIARALAALGYLVPEEMREPGERLLIADEPVSGLDAITRNYILHKLKGYKEQLNLTLLVISHSLKVVEALCGDSVELMNNGHIIQDAEERERFMRQLIEAELPLHPPESSHPSN